jgi:uncharacterized protein (TIGR02145 family)
MVPPIRINALIFICSLVFPIALFSQTGSITNLQVSQRSDGSGNFDIYYDLQGPGSMYFINMEVSFDNGVIFTAVSSTFLSGISGVIPGTYRHLIWNGKGSHNNTWSAQTKIKLIAVVQGPPCPGIPTVTDPRNGKIYNTVQVGTQCWLKENLNIGTRINVSQGQTNNGIIEKYCYNDLEANCDVYGGLYQWKEMMQYVSLQGIKGICLTGWHIPTDAEWTTLTTCLGGASVAGGKMKETGNSHWNPLNTNATNESGFTALPGGYRHYNGYFIYSGDFAFFWSSYESYPSFSAGSRYLFRNNTAIVKNDYDYETNGLSVRCIKNN